MPHLEEAWMKTDHEVQTHIEIENMAQKEYCAEPEKGQRRVFRVNESSAFLTNQTLMKKQIETLTKHVQEITMGSYKPNRLRFNKFNKHLLLSATYLVRCMLMMSVCRKD